MRIVATMLLSIILCGVTQVYPAIKLNPLYVKAQEYENQGELDKAREIYEQLYEAERTDIYFYKLINLYERTGDFTSIETLAGKRLVDRPGNTEAMRFLARSYFGQGKREKAREILFSMVEKNWKDSNMVRLVANELFYQEEHDEAIQIFLTAREKQGDLQLYAIEIARMYTFTRRFIPAIEEYLKVLDSIDVVYGNVALLINQALTEDYGFDEVSRPLAVYLEQHPASLNAARLLSDVRYRAGDYQGAQRVLMAPARTGQNGSVFVWRLAEQLKNDRHHREALAVYEDFYRYFPQASNRVQALMEAATLKTGLGETDSARKDYEILIEDYSGTIHAEQATLRLFRLMAEDTNFDTFTKSLETLATTTTYREVAHEAYFLLGETFMRHDKLQEARRAFTSAKLKAKNNEEIHRVSVTAARLSFFTGEYELMNREIEESVRTLPDGEDINDLLAWKVLAMRCGSTGEADRLRLFARGQFDLYRGDNAAAIEAFLSAAQDTTSIVTAHAANTLGKLYREEGDFNRAMDWYLLAAKASPDTTLRVGALIEAADIAESELHSDQQAKGLYFDAMTAYPGSVYESELRDKLRRLVE